MNAIHKQSFADRYGPWALISGASDGLGAALAVECARAGLNCALIARRVDMLEALATDLSKNFNVETRVHPLDLMEREACNKLASIASDLDIGLYLINAGGDTVASRFIDADIGRWRELIARNVSLLTETVHVFARNFVERGRGGIGIVGSDSGFNGAGRVSVYSASKAYALGLIESIWAELQDQNVDATYFAIGATDTPKLRGLMEMRGVAPDQIHLTPPEDLARWMIENLGNGPTQVFDVDPGSLDPLTSPTARRERVERNTRIIDFFFGDLQLTEETVADLRSGRSWK